MRINSISSGLAGEDLSAVMQSRYPPTTLVVPKVDTLDESAWVGVFGGYFVSFAVYIGAGAELVNSEENCRLQVVDTILQAEKYLLKLIFPNFAKRQLLEIRN